jgi:hypothetical protein
MQGARKAGGGSGKLIAIILAAFVVVGGGGAAAVFFLGGGSSLSDDVDQSAALKAQVQALQAAVKTKDTKQVEVPLLNLAMMPDKAKAWFIETFGPQLGKECYEEWERAVFRDLPELIVPFRDSLAKGRTEIRVRRLTGGPTELTPLPASVLRMRKKPRALYYVTFMEPGLDYGDDLYFFAIVDGKFAYLGNMVSAWQK